MSAKGDDRGRLARALGVRTASEGDAVTTLELLFDLVFVFAFTQVTFLMAHGEPPVSIVQGVVVMALLWWSWSSFAWLGNQAHANEGIVRAALIVAMAAVFVLSLTIPEAFHDLDGGLYAPLVFATCYAVVRLVHLSTYLIAAGRDMALRRQVMLSLTTSALPAIVLLIVGALVDEQWRLLVWTAAVVVDLLAIHITSNVGGSWRLQSVAHFTERHRLVVILALGESIVAIGVGVSLDPITVSILIGSLLAIGLTVALWWVYFQRIADEAERMLERVDAATRAKIAADGYTYLHLPIVFSVILTALGIEEVMSHLNETHLDWFGGSALAAGVALFLAGTGLFWLRMSNAVLAARFVCAVIVAAAIPLWSTLRDCGRSPASSPSCASLLRSSRGSLAMHTPAWTESTKRKRPQQAVIPARENRLLGPSSTGRFRSPIGAALLSLPFGTAVSDDFYDGARSQDAVAGASPIRISLDGRGCPRW